MPARIARSSVQIAAPKNARNKNRKRNLDAYSIASHSTQDRKRIPQHRLGESLDDDPKPKRRRVEDDDEDGEGEDSDEEGQRRKVRKRTVAGAGDDGVEEGSDSEGNEWTLGGLAEDDEDSDLDSDEAFGESDEEKFEGFTFRGSSSSVKKPTKRKEQAGREKKHGEEINLDEEVVAEEDEGDEDSLGEDAVDLATMLDNDEDDIMGGESTMSEESATDDVDDTDESAESDEEDHSEGENGADDEERMARLRDRIDAMDAINQPEKARAPLNESNALTVDDLLADVDPTTRKQFAAPKTKKSAASTTLATPLPKRQQDRLDRRAATEKAKEQLDRWRDTVIHNRRAEFLSFPLKDPQQSEPIGKDRFVSLTDGREKPQTELEESIQRIMEESGMLSKAGEKPADEESELLKAEELAANNMPVEEVMRRRAELRRTRELLFREEIKAKRIAKIKSKSYRRVHRKERERLAEKERALLDPEGLGLNLDDDEREQADRRRAEARMGTKHRDSKWARSLKATNRTVWDEGARDGVLEQARRQEELRRRVAGDDIDDDDSGSDVPSVSEGDDGGSGDDEDARTLRQLTALKETGTGIGQKGVGAMKFMRDADERKRLQNDEDVERLRKEMAIADGDEAEVSEWEDEGLGRAIFGPKANESKAIKKAEAKRGELEEGDMSDFERDEVQGGHGAADAQAAPPDHTSSGGIVKKRVTVSGPLSKGLPPDCRNPTRQEAVEEGGITSSWLTDAGAKKSKRDRTLARSADDGTILTMTDLDSIAKPAKALPKPTAEPKGGPAATGSSVGKAADGWMSVPYKNTPADEDEVSDAEPENAILSAQDQKAEFHRRAFAGDDVQLAFEAEKAADAAEEDEQEVSTHLPGWGSWTGSGLSKSIKKANQRAKHNPLYKTKLPGGVKAENRKDRKLDNVIVSEKQDRKGKKYLAPMLPHEFERKEQYERSLRVPMGPEWTTKEVFQRNTRPRVVVRQGIVAPMEKPVV